MHPRYGVPASNGMIKWYSIKALRLRSLNTTTFDRLIIGLYTHVRLDTNASIAKFMYGMTLRISGEFVFLNDFTFNLHVLKNFTSICVRFKPVPMKHKHKKYAFCFEDLFSCTYIFSSGALKNR